MYAETMNPDVSDHRLRPVAYVSMQDAARRARVIAVLEGAGWTVVTQPSGFHVVHAIADVIEGRRAWLQPSLIVIDTHSPGCAGTTVALGLRELGIEIPIVLVGSPGETLPVSPDQMLRIVDASAADAAVAEIAAVGRSPRPWRS